MTKLPPELRLTREPVPSKLIAGAQKRLAWSKGMAWLSFGLAILSFCLFVVAKYEQGYWLGQIEFSWMLSGLVSIVLLAYSLELSRRLTGKLVRNAVDVALFLFGALLTNYFDGQSWANSQIWSHVKPQQQDFLDLMGSK